METQDILSGMINYFRDRAPLSAGSFCHQTPDKIKKEILIDDSFRRFFSNKSILEIASGTGHYTKRAANHCDSVLGVDVNSDLVNFAAKECHDDDKIKFAVADAFNLNLPKKFDGAFAIHWWSHIPKEKVADFIKCLHGQLSDDAPVLLVDDLKKAENPEVDFIDEHGNQIIVKKLANGKEYPLVKNFPKREDFFYHLSGQARNIRYFEDVLSNKWYLSYNYSGSI